jgi:hypothetical protein
MSKPSVLAAAAAATLALALSLTAGAEQPNIEPGEWQYTNVTTFEGAMQLPEQRQVERECITPEQLAEGNAFLADTPDECQISNLSMTRDQMSYDIACREPDSEMNMNLQLQFMGNRVTGKVNGTIDNPAGEILMNVTIEGERLGEC